MLKLAAETDRKLSKAQRDRADIGKAEALQGRGAATPDLWFIVLSSAPSRAWLLREDEKEEKGQDEKAKEEKERQEEREEEEGKCWTGWHMLPGHWCWSTA